jgi:hypothetical protein
MSRATVRNRIPAPVRAAAAALCALVVSALLLSSAVLAARSHHEHDHEGADGGCAVCGQLCAAGYLLCSFGTAAFAAVLALAPPRLRAGHGVCRGASAARLFSLVSLKVRLNI